MSRPSPRDRRVQCWHESRSETERSVSRRSILVSVVVGLFLCGTIGAFFGPVGIAAAQNTAGPVEGTVELDATADDEEFEAGEEQTLELVISNDGQVTTDGTHPTAVRDLVTRAESTDIEITDAPSEIDVRTGEQSVGDIDSGETVVEPFDLFVEDDAPAGEYDLEVTAEYTNVTVTEYEQNEDGELIGTEEQRESETETFTVTIEVEQEPAFAVDDLEHSVQVDESGELAIDLENIGGEDAEDVVVTAESTDQDVFFGAGGATAERSVAEWEAGETETIVYEVGTAADAITEPYPIELTIEFSDQSGEDGTDTVQTELTPLDRQQFVVTGTDHDVSIGDDGVLDVELENVGPQNITNASVTIQSNDPAVSFPEGTEDDLAATTQTFVDDWNANETREISVRVAVGSDGVDRSYTLEASIDARDERDRELNERTREFGFEPEPKQRYTIEDVTHNLAIGDDARVDLAVKNHGPQNVTESTITLETGDSALTFEDGTTTTEIFVGDWEANETRTVATRLAASDEAVEAEYTIDAAVNARDESDSELGTREREFGIEPLPRQQYSVGEIDHDVAIDDDGVLQLELTNEGPLNLTDASVELTADDPAISFGLGTGEAIDVDGSTFETDGAGDPSSEAFVGEWEVNETRTVSYRLAAGEQTLQREYTLTATVDARDENDDRLTERSREFGFSPLSEQSFAIENSENTLRVGEDGDIEGTVTNTGDRTARNVVVQLDDSSETVLPRETAYAIGSLEPGETADFQFRIGISEEAEAGPRVFEFETRYRNSEGDIRVDSSQDIFAEVAPERDSFGVEPVEASFEAGSSETVTLELTNNRDETVENVRAKVFPDSPLDSDDDEAFVSELQPGETERFVFDLSVDSAAVSKEYPLSVDIRYEDERGERQLSGTYEVPVDVETPADGGIPLWLLGTAVLVLGIGAIYFRERLAAFGSRIADGDS